MTFPRCELHGHNIVTEFPEGCLFKSESVVEAQMEFRSRSFPDPNDDPHTGEVFAKLDRVCGACVTKNMGHPHVQHLRRKAGFNDRSA